MKGIATTDTHKGLSKDTHAIHEKHWDAIAAQEPDFLFHSGDAATSKQLELESTFGQMRDRLGDELDIYYVRGNHDLWDRSHKHPGKPKHHRTDKMTYGETLLYHDELFAEFNIKHLDAQGHWLTPKSFVAGFDGWYGTTDHKIRQTNDDTWIPRLTGNPETLMEHLSQKAFYDLKKCHELLAGLPEGTFRILMTHFPAFSDGHPEWNANKAYHSVMIEHADLLLVGHNHQFKDDIENGCRIVNAGSDYDQPRFIEFEIP